MAVANGFEILLEISFLKLFQLPSLSIDESEVNQVY